MTREIQVLCPTKPPKAKSNPEAISKTYLIQVITPIFGGGVKAGENDPITLIRPSSIRGHLRFWWRATRGAKFESSEQLRQREGEIWGTTNNPSPVSIEVAVQNYGISSECARYEWNPQKSRGEGGYDLRWSRPFDTRGSPLPYALFPFQGKAPESSDPKEPSKMVISASFRLILHIPNSNRMEYFRPIYNEQRESKNLPLLFEKDNDVERDIDAALWAWLNFGGVGARSRRGCGALYCIQSDPLDEDLTPPNLHEFKVWLKGRISYYELSSALRDWPTFAARVLLKEGEDPISCWENCVEIMKDLRQGVGIGRDSGSRGRPGRSRWPEPESLRNLALAQKGLRTRPNNWHPPDSRIREIAFPRVEFGMPIIIEIRGEDIKPTLQPNAEHDRMASPLILRPIQFKDSGFGSMIVRLNTLPLKSAYMKPGGKYLESGYVITTPQIRNHQITEYPDSPMSELCDTGSALDAFIAYAKEKGNDFQEVG